MVKLSAVDHIYTITEGRGIIGALCGGRPCDPLARGLAAVAPKGATL
jgi:hypothetical protein